MKTAAIALATLLLAGAAFAGDMFDDDCEYTAPRRTASPAAGVTKVVIHGESGSLQVDGRPGVTQIVAAGTACTSDEDFLDRIVLTARRQGSELHIDANIPDKTVLFGFFQARLDFSVVIPDGVPVMIDDDSGWIKVANTGSVDIDDDSGSIEVRNVRGNVTIDDDSGAIDVDTVTGNVKISDDSGAISIKNITGNVQLEDDSGAIVIATITGGVHIRNDDSGAIEISNVRRDVLIDSDSSGGIEVANIGGNFTVGRKGSGSINYTRVSGRVDIPERHRR